MVVVAPMIFVDDSVMVAAAPTPPQLKVIVPPPDDEAENWVSVLHSVTTLEAGARGDVAANSASNIVAPDPASSQFVPPRTLSIVLPLGPLYHTPM